MDNFSPVIADLRGLVVETDEIELLKHEKLGGICLFARNFENPDQLIKLCDDIRHHASNELLICVDQEGGRIQRFLNGFTKLPSAQLIGQIFDVKPSAGIDVAGLSGSIMAQELLQSGVDLSFAPVIDLDKNLSSVIGNRAFHSDPARVIQLASAFMNGMHRVGMCAVVKHFPGHGNVSADSHHEMPIDERDLDDILNQDGVPFKGLIDNGCDAVMTAHIKFSKIDVMPPTFSKLWIDEVLRNRLGFAGIVFSDDLSMGGASVGDSPLQRADSAYQAGCNGLLVCNDQQAARQVLEGLTGQPRRPLHDLLPYKRHNPKEENFTGQLAEWKTKLRSLLA